ncbi:Cof-type HAD-IIB family hydrolase [Mycoplasma elephantis]|uniref:Cof-type HAD-IIB family hydrolase n=1 Tax=Mycoplasma elephantis TaxID=114882 RepID=UPI00047FCC5C|nr:Cof-type HAD-IIB family hydrolase [Mycoplasma elephantis]
MKKIYAFDADGTLLTKDSVVHPQTKEILKKIKNNGGILVVATGRGLPSAKLLLDEVPFFDYIVCSNGAVVYDIKKDKYTILKTLNPEHIQYFMDIKNKYDLVLTIDTPMRDFTLVKNDGDTIPEWYKYEDFTTGFDSRVYSKEKDVWDYMKIGNNKNTIAKYAVRIKEAENVMWHDKISQHVTDAKAYITNRFFIDVNPAGTSKFTGIQYVLKLLRENSSHLVAFGDSNNDIEMIENAHIGVAMGNATEELKSVADVIIGDHNEGSIGLFLKNEI